MRVPVHSYSLDAKSAESARLVNCYAEKGDSKEILLKSAPGIRTLCTLTGGGRGIVASTDGLFAIAGSQMYRVQDSGISTSIGGLAGTTRASFAVGASQIAISINGGGYVYESGTLTQITDADFDPPGGVAFLDGYALWVHRDTGQFFASDLNSFKTYDALWFATAESAADNLVGIEVDHRQAVLFGSNSIELWYNAGGSGFPFERVPSGVIELGGLASQGACKADNTVFFLASDKTARRLSGSTPQRISTHAVEARWASYTSLTDCQCMSMTYQGHIWVVFRFPTDQACWVYDVTTGEWFERESYPDSTWRVCSVAEWGGVTYVQDADTGSVGILDGDVFTEWGDYLRAEWTYQGVRDSGRLIRHSELSLGIECGAGSLNTDPQVMLSISDDGGHKYTSLSSQGIGKQGDYGKRVRWNRLGSSTNRVYRMAYSDASPLTVYDTQLRVA